MEPVEVNAGAWYLRALRDDDRLSDVRALELLTVPEPAAYVAASNAGWHSETRFIWAVCIPTTGEAVALIGVRPSADQGTGELSGIARPGHADALDAAVGPISRFADGALGLRVGALNPTHP